MGTVDLRRVPKQQRSREKYDRVLTVASRLIAERGNDAVSMREIAEAAELPISSVYQYFPDKNSILWTILSGHFETLEKKWLLELQQTRSFSEVTDCALALFDEFVALCRSEPTFSRLWRSVQANAVLMELDQAFNERIADALLKQLQVIGIQVENKNLWTSLYLMASLSSSALQLAFNDEARCKDILAEFRRMIRAQLPKLDS